MPYFGSQPTSVPLTSSDITDGIISNAKLAQDIISADTALGAEPADTDELLVSDAGVLKRMDYSYIKGGGKIGQVVQTVHTGTETLSSETPTTIPNFTVSITPAATSSKILVTTNAMISVGNNYTCGFSLYRDTTELYIGDAASNRDRLSWSSHQYGTNRLWFMAAISYLDSPSSTSELDYSLKWLSQDSTAMYLNRTPGDADYTDYDNRTASSITVMEVLA